MPIDDAKTYPLTPSHVMDLQRRAARRAAVGRPGFSRLYRGDPDGNAEGAASGPTTSVTRLRAPQRLRSCFRSARPSLASFDTEWFLNLCLAARNLDDVNAIFHLIYEGIGASAGALVNIGPTRYTPIFELLIDVPDTLLEAIRARRVIDDPMAVACEQRVLGFSASDLERIIEMNDRRRETMAIYAAHELNEGFTVPFCVPGEPRGYCSFGFTDPEDLTTDVMAIINLAGGVLFETARRVLGMWVERRRNAELTPRQVDCLAFAARGLNDGQIAWELGISTQTVHEHFESARKRYGAHKRLDLMVCAIRSGDLHWDRITGRDQRAP